MDLLTPALHQNHVLDCIFERLPSRQHAASSTTTAQQTPRQRPSAHAGHPQGAASMSVEQSIMAIPEATAENPVQGVSEGQHAVNTKDEQRHNSPEAMSLDDPSADHRQASPTPRKNRSGACEPYSLR